LLKISQLDNAVEQRNHTQHTLPSATAFSLSNDYYSFSQKMPQQQLGTHLDPRTF